MDGFSSFETECLSACSNLLARAATAIEKGDASRREFVCCRPGSSARGDGPDELTALVADLHVKAGLAREAFEALRKYSSANQFHRRIGELSVKLIACDRVDTYDKVGLSLRQHDRISMPWSPPV